MVKVCGTKGMATEKDHLPGCQHQQECVSCGRFLLRHVTRFPLGANKIKMCVFCFRSKFIEMAKSLDIDWKAIEKSVNGRD